MPMTDERAAAFERARNDLRTLLTASNLSQADLASHLGTSQPNLSKRLARDKTAIFDHIAEHFPPACWVAARLYTALARIYLDAWDSMIEEPERDLRQKIVEMERMINEVRER